MDRLINCGCDCQLVASAFATPRVSCNNLASFGACTIVTKAKEVVMTHALGGVVDLSVTEHTLIIFDLHEPDTIVACKPADLCLQGVRPK